MINSEDRKEKKHQEYRFLIIGFRGILFMNNDEIGMLLFLVAKA
jgi:hypothetical protein